MGNGTSKSDAVTVATGRSLVSNNSETMMKKIHDALDGTAKCETDGMVGCKNRSEAKKRAKERKSEFQVKQKERLERKSKLSEQWASHRDQNAARAKKSLFGNKKVEPKHWYDD